MIKIITAALLLLLLLPLFGENDSKNILVLHSYSINFRWTEEMHKGIVTAFEQSEIEVYLSVEFLDSKFHYSESFAEEFSGILQKKYNNYHLDGILVTDNNALNFIRHYGNSLFPEVPVVACGINGGVPDLTETDIIRIVPEQANHLATFHQALRIFPETDRINVIVDSTLTGELISQELPPVFRENGKIVEITFLRDYEFQELLNHIKNLPPNELLYLLPYFKDEAGNYFSQGRAEKNISRAAGVPVFISWDYQKDTGVLGGNLLNSFEIGRNSGEELLYYLSTGRLKTDKDKPLETSFNSYDYNVMQRFGLSPGDIPDNSLLINKAPSFFSKHKLVLIPSALIISVLLSMIYLLANHLKNQKEIHIKNDKIIQITEEFMDTQREIIIKLGEVIEKRSKETGEHISRVAEISGFLAEKIGMQERDIDVLKAASPLHDIGKIGIPDLILNSHQKLTPDEHRIMQQHTIIGSEILSGSTKPIFLTARKIARWHHEKWDGTGYPDGLKEGEIPVEARITMIADIYDALSNERCYKESWEPGLVKQYLLKERGTFFDPQLTDIFLDNFYEILRRF